MCFCVFNFYGNENIIMSYANTNRLKIIHEEEKPILPISKMAVEYLVIEFTVICTSGPCTFRNDLRKTPKNNGCSLPLTSDISTTISFEKVSVDFIKPSHLPVSRVCYTTYLLRNWNDSSFIENIDKWPTMLLSRPFITVNNTIARAHYVRSKLKINSEDGADGKLFKFRIRNG